MGRNGWDQGEDWSMAATSINFTLDNYLICSQSYPVHVLFTGGSRIQIHLVTLIQLTLRWGVNFTNILLAAFFARILLTKKIQSQIEKTREKLCNTLWHKNANCKMFVNLTIQVSISPTYILAAFTRKGPKSAMRKESHQWLFFAFLGSSCIIGARNCRWNCVQERVETLAYDIGSFLVKKLFPFYLFIHWARD